MKIIKMSYSIEPRDRLYVKRYGFFSFAKNMGKNETEIDVEKATAKKRNISPKERQQIIDELRLKFKNIHISRRKTTNY